VNLTLNLQSVSVKAYKTNFPQATVSRTVDSSARSTAREQGGYWSARSPVSAAICSTKHHQCVDCHVHATNALTQRL